MNSNLLNEVEGKEVLHIGAFMGEEKTYYDSRGWNVIWVEAQSELCERLAMGGETVYQLAISDENGVGELNVANNKASSSLLDFGTHKNHYPHIETERTEEVTLITLDSFIEKYNIKSDILNIDIEGMGNRVLKAANLEQFNYIYAEAYLEDLYEGCGTLEELNEILSDYKLIYQNTPHKGWCDVLYKRK